MAIQLTQIDHLALVCADAQASSQWYQKVLGMEWIHRGQWDGNPVFLEIGGTRLALFQAGSNPDPARRTGLRIDHFAFLVDSMEAFLSAQAHLRNLNISFAFEDHEIAYSIYFSDPDGHKVEITTYAVADGA